MVAKLRVLAGPSLDRLEPITDIVNTRKTYPIRSDHFDGHLAVHAKDLPGSNGNDPYFDLEERKGVTWSIQVKGRFLDVYSADDILFGNVFDHALKLPYGSAAVFKLMSYIDPTLENDLGSSTRPYALSPLIATMPHFAHTRISPLPIIDDIDDVDDLPEPQPLTPDLDPTQALAEDLSQLHLTLTYESSSSESSVTSTSSKTSKKSNRSGLSLVSSKKKKRKSINDVTDIATAAQRKLYFTDPKNRAKLAFGPEDVLSVDFCYGYINFNPTLSLALPGGVNFDLMKYWDGQPVRFVCCERRFEDSEDDSPYNRIFWCVSIEPSDE